MKGAFLLSEDPKLFEHAATVLQRQGAAYSGADGGVVQIKNEAGYLLTLFGKVSDEAAWEYRSSPDAVAPGVEVPDLEHITACWVECRDEAWFVEEMAALASALRVPTWVLDGNGVLWNAREIDVDGLTL